MNTKQEILDAIIRNPYGAYTLPSGNFPSRFIIIKESPDYTELLTGISFVSSLGSIIKHEMRQANLHLEEAYFTNAIKSEKQARVEWMNHYKTYWQPILETEISLCKPEYIITIGSMPIRFSDNDKRKIINISSPVNPRHLRDAFENIKIFIDKDKPYWEPGENGHVE